MVDWRSDGRQQGQAHQRLPLEYIAFLVVGLLTSRLLSLPSIGPVLNIGGPELWPGLHPQNVLVDLWFMSGFVFLALYRRWWAPAAARSRFRFTVIWCMIALVALVVGRTFVRIATHAPRMTHDGVVQSEVAARFLLQGKNPYAVSYRGTQLDVEVASNIPDTRTLFTHYVYPPLVPVMTIPIIWFADMFHAPVEPQYAYLAILVIAVVLILRRIPNWTTRSYVFLATIGMPLFVLYTMGGYNDMIAFGLLFMASVLLLDRRWRLAGLMFGLALAAKQTIWFYLPLWAALLWFQRRTVPWRDLRNHVLWVVGTAAVFYLPFLIANAPALIDDLIRFPGASIPGSYPIGGSTFWQFAVLRDSTHYYWQSVPSSIVLAIVGTIMYVVAFMQVRRQPNVPSWLFWTSLTLLVISMVNRFNYDNYVSSIAFTLVMAVILDRYVVPKNISS